MNSLVIFFSCLALLQSASALKCYSCDSSRVTGCVEIVGDTHAVTCGQPFSQKLSPACLKQVSKDSKGSETIVRKCVVVEGDKVDSECRPTKPDDKVEYCGGCKDDLCNGAISTHVGIASIFSAVFVYLLLKL